MYEGILVRLVSYRTDEMIRAYNTSNLSETVKMYEHLIDNEKVPIVIPKAYERDNYSDGYENKEVIVKAVEVLFGDGTNELSVNVYVDI